METHLNSFAITRQGAGGDRMNLNPARMLLRFISLKDTRPGWSCTLEISGILDLEKDSTFLFVGRLACFLPIAAVEKTLLWNQSVDPNC